MKFLIVIVFGSFSSVESFADAKCKILKAERVSLVQSEFGEFDQLMDSGWQAWGGKDLSIELAFEKKLV